MLADDAAVTAAYLEHLNDGDVLLLAGPAAAGRTPAEARSWLRGRRGGIDDRLTDPQVVQTVFSRAGGNDPVSPFLLFAVAVHQTARGLASAPYVPEWAGVGRRTPVFDVDRVRAYIARPWHQLFLVELLASFTHVASGSVLVATRRGLRRRRFSELDPVRLAGLLEVVSDAERPGVLRRLGDLALFLTGVFPDHVGRRGFGPIERDRLWRAGGRTPAAPGQPAVLPDDSAVGLLELLGRRWYQAAFDLLPRPVPANLAVLGELPGHFGLARRFLGLVTERYLFPLRGRWFDLSGG